jgi:hypothetical protein
MVTPLPALSGLSGWIDPRRQALLGLASGLVGGNTLHEGLSTGFARAAQGRVQDDAFATAKKDEAERAKQLNYTIQAFQKAGRQDLVDMANAGMMSEAWNQFNKPKKTPIEVNGQLVDPDTFGILGDFRDPQDASGGGPYGGTSMDAQNWNIVLTGDPNSPEYAAAYSQIAQPKMTMQQTDQGLVPIWSSPQLPPNIRPPAGVAQASPIGGGAGGVTTGSVVPGTQKPPTEQRARAQMMDSVISPEIETLLGDGTAQNPGAMDALNNGWDVAKDATGTTGRYVPFGMGTPSEGYLKAKNSVRTLIASYLYVVSGATANPGEVENQAAILTPQVNDPPDVVKGKKARIKVMADAVKALARGENVDLNAVMAGAPTGSTGDPELDAALQQYGG